MLFQELCPSPADPQKTTTHALYSAPRQPRNSGSIGGDVCALPSSLSLSALQTDPSIAIPGGFLFGYSVYTSFPWPLASRWLTAHLNRLASNARSLDLAWPFSNEDIIAQLETAMAVQQHTTPLENTPYTMLRLTAVADVTHYGEFYERDASSSKAIPMRLFLSTRPVPENLKGGISLKTVSYQRPLAHLKHSAMADSILLKRQARTEGFDDVLFLNQSEQFCEASTANVFIIKDGRLHTPDPYQQACLPGITRAVILEQAQRLGLEVAADTAIPLSRAQAAEGVFLSNAAQGIIPVQAINQQALPWPPEALELLHTLTHATQQALYTV